MTVILFEKAILTGQHKVSTDLITVHNLNLNPLVFIVFKTDVASQSKITRAIAKKTNSACIYRKTTRIISTYILVCINLFPLI